MCKCADCDDPHFICRLSRNKQSYMCLDYVSLGFGVVCDISNGFDTCFSGTCVYDDNRELRCCPNNLEKHCGI